MLTWSLFENYIKDLDQSDSTFNSVHGVSIKQPYNVCMSHYAV